MDPLSTHFDAPTRVQESSNFFSLHDRCTNSEYCHDVKVCYHSIYLRIILPAAMSIFTRRRLSSLLHINMLTFVLCLPSLAQSNFNILSISPPTNDVSEQAPPAPARVSLFAWQGNVGTEYTINFASADEPSLVVGVGAEILTTSFDANADILTVVVKYNGDKILSDENVILPDGIFMIALDPGVDASLLPSATDSKQGCYGPGANPKLYEDSSSDFGEDDGLNEPEPPAETTTIGLPYQAAGTFASTNAFYWCIVAPKGTSQGVGMRLMGKQNATAKLSLSLSPGLLSFMGERISRSAVASNLGIFSNDLQVGTAVFETTDGVEISLSLPLNTESTKINITPNISSRASRKARLIAAATEAKTLEQRTISIGFKEPLTLTPESLTVVGNKVIFSGFVDDLSLAGKTIEILRLGGNQKCGVNISALKGTVIARGVIKSDGSYSVQIPASAVFNNNSKNSKLVARIPGDSVRTSREVSLSNRNRNLRQ